MNFKMFSLEKLYCKFWSFDLLILIFVSQMWFCRWLFDKLKTPRSKRDNSSDCSCIKYNIFLTLVKWLAEVIWCKLYTLSNTQTSNKSTDKLSSKILGKYKFRNIIFNLFIILFHLQMLFIIYWKQMFWIKFLFLLLYMLYNEDYTTNIVYTTIWIHINSLFCYMISSIFNKHLFSFYNWILLLIRSTKSDDY